MRRAFALLGVLVLLSCGREGEGKASEVERIFLAFEADSGWGAMTPEGKVLFFLKGAKYLGRFSEGLAPFSPDGLHYGYVDTLGKVVIPPNFTVAEDFKDGLAVVGGERYGVIGKDGRYRVPSEYVKIERAGNGRFWARTRNAWILVDTSGRRLTDTYLEEFYPFGEGGWAKVKTAEGWGVIDTSGRWLVKPRYRYVEGYAGDVFLVRDSTGWGYVRARKVIYWRKVPKLPSAESLNVAPEVKIKIEPPKLK